MLSYISFPSWLPRAFGATTCHHFCMSTKAVALNEKIKEVLKAEIKQQEGLSTGPNRYKLKAFSRALETMERVDYPIHSVTQLEKMKGFGFGISKRVAESLGFDIKNSAPMVQEDVERIRIREKLSDVHGIGAVKITKLIDAGCTGVKDLLKPMFRDMLSTKQRMVLQYHKSLGEPVLLEEAERLAQFIREKLPSGWEVNVVGDLRRLVSSSSSIELLFIQPGPGPLPMPEKPFSAINPKPCPRPFSPYNSKSKRMASPFYQTIIPLVQNSGLHVAEVVSSVNLWEAILRLPESGTDGNGWGSLAERKAGVKNRTGTFRKVILRYASIKSRGAALISFTGDSMLHRSMRLRANKIGLYLDEVGLWRWHADIRPEDREASEERGFWELLQSSTEQEIFEQLGMEWLEPDRRNFKFISQN